MAQDHGAVGGQVVDVTVAVHVVKVGAFPVGDKRRGASSDGGVGAGWGVDPAADAPLGALKQLLGTLKFHEGDASWSCFLSPHYLAVQAPAPACRVLCRRLPSGPKGQ